VIGEEEKRLDHRRVSGTAAALVSAVGVWKGFFSEESVAMPLDTLSLVWRRWFVAVYIRYYPKGIWWKRCFT
jgi:hypothetical protein